MKTKKIFLVALLLLAVLTIGAVSASESTDELAVEDAEELSVDESPADVVANDGESPEFSPDDLNVNINSNYNYSTDENNQEQLNNFQFSAPEEFDGNVSISSNGQTYSKEFKELDKMWGFPVISPKDVTFLKDLQTDDLVSFSFLKEDTPIKISNYKIY